MKQTSASGGLPLFALFERILGFSLGAELLAENIICSECVIRFNDYDEAIQRAERVSGELMQLFGSKIINPYSFECSLQVKTEDPAELNVAVVVDNVDNSIKWAIPEPPAPVVKIVAYKKEKKLGKSNKSKLKFQSPANCMPCAKCNRKCKSEADLAEHECNVPSVVTARTFICDICGQSYKTKGGLAIHMIIHSEERRHSCLVCGKSFTARVALARHTPIHTREMNYQVIHTYYKIKYDI